MSIATTYNNNVYFVSLTGETTYAIPSRNSRSSICIKNLSSPDVTCTCWTGETADGLTSFTLKGYCAIEMIRGTTEWVIVRSYDKLEEVNAGTIGEEATVDGDGEFTITGGAYIGKKIVATNLHIIDTAVLDTLTSLTVLDTDVAAGTAFTNQPTNDGVTVVSASAADTTQTVTIIGTTNGSDTVVVETVTLTGTTPVNTTKVNWGVILAVKKSAATAGTVTVKETSLGATITAGLTAAVLSVGVELVAAADQPTYGRKAFLVAGGASTKQLGVYGINSAGVAAYDSQALDGATPVFTNTVFNSITEVYVGDIAAATAIKVKSDARIMIPAVGINFAGLPTSATGLQAGDLYTNSKVLTIV